ncbi:hypothetical protein V3Q90_07165 [Flavobacterium oreochromis]|uniref:hypothetical protein n=1 Tax=Flavobacterium oreochromis TaxID=2906078 RepID=UPI003859F1DE
MILDSVSSFIENLKTKVSNPFFGTLTAVWLVRNWKLVYGLFIFDDNYKMNDKFKFVTEYYKNKSIYNELWTNILITFYLLILGYILLIISRFLANLVEHRITPNINRIAASKLVANKDILNELELQLLQKTNDLINERKLVNELELQLVDIRVKVETATNEKNSATSKLFEQTKQAREAKRSVEILEEKNNILSDDIKKSREIGQDLRKIAEKCEELNSKENIAFSHLDCFLALWNYNLINVYSQIVSEFDSGTKKYKTAETNNTLLKILYDNKITTATFSTEERTTTITYTNSGEEFARIFNKLKKEFDNIHMPW